MFDIESIDTDHMIGVNISRVSIGHVNVLIMNVIVITFKYVVCMNLPKSNSFLIY